MLPVYAGGMQTCRAHAAEIAAGERPRNYTYRHGGADGCEDGRHCRFAGYYIS
ncbi:MAG: hypothetical protein K2L51_06255 [Clostridiales bacterium]|nr:hypothetical protein [Clostridiales bacterium]